MTPGTAGQVPLSCRPIVAFTGPFGSGKTEVAINYSLAALAQGRATVIVDLDIVTPYFRVGDHRQQLSERGLEVIAPPGPLASFEVPALPPEIEAALRREDAHIVLDVGGDPVGAHLLGAYAPHLTPRGPDMWLVVNPFRPSFSSDSLAHQARAIEAASPLTLTGLVASPHLGPDTQPPNILDGLARVQEAAEHLRLPIVFLAAIPALLGQLPPVATPLLPLCLFLRPPWDQA